MIKFRYISFVLTICLFGCKKPYTPTIASSQSNYLVVEGLINSGNDSTLIKLSRTVKISDTTKTINPVLDAQVTVESDQNGSWSLFDTNNNGVYGSASLNLPASQKYRLRISTPDGRKYLSDFIAVRPTPAIDSIGYFVKDKIVNIYVNTHDPANKTRYYRWDYHETWYFHAMWDSAYVLDIPTDSIVQRTRNQSVHFCYGDLQSSNILINSTAKLSNDVIYQNPITQVPLTSEKVENKYSILVKQYAITPEAYEFYQNVLKNTEKLGNIFDAQPSQLNGNIHCLTNPAEPVIGYIGVTNVQSKRIFIPATDLNNAATTIYPYGCVIDTAEYGLYLGSHSIENELLTFPVTNIPIDALGGGLPPQAFIFSKSVCVDCTLRGTKKMPSFWK
jgi:hypothetical protein